MKKIKNDGFLKGGRHKMLRLVAGAFLLIFTATVQAVVGERVTGSACMELDMGITYGTEMSEEEDTLAANHPEYLPSIATGSVAPEIAARDTAGVEIKLSQFRGKYVVLDFWATWCGDCRREVPGLKLLYEETRGRKAGGKEIQWLSFSFDNKEKDWKDFLRKEQFAWPQVSNLKRTREDPTFNAYQLSWIPAFLIIAPDGTVVAKAITAQGLRAGLLKLLDSK